MEKNPLQFTASGKTVEIYPSAAPNRPVIYTNTFPEDVAQIQQALEKMKCPDFSLVAISGLDWNHDMTPWENPPITKNDTPCTGGADDYLRLLTEEILPEAEKALPGTPSWRGITGYSLAGLFAVYAIYRTDLFSRAASISGSLWFPGFKEYAVSHEMKGTPEYLYFSVGDKECKTRNQYMKTVQTNTEELVAFCRDRQISTEFQLNPGGHFTESTRRSAQGILWMLTR